MTFRKPLLVTFSLLAFAGAAHANQSFSELDKNNDGTLSRAEFQALERTEARGIVGSMMRDTQINASEAHASKLIGMDVVNRQGEDLGEIKELIVDLRGGRVHAAVLEFGGFLGLGEKQYAFPVSQLKVGQERDKLVLNLDKDKLKNAQGFERNRWPSMDDQYWTRVGGERVASAGQSKPGQATKMQLVRASELMGKEVQDRSGRDVGEVQELIVSLNDARVRHYVLDLDEGGERRIQPNALSSGIGEKLVVTMSRTTQ